MPNFRAIKEETDRFSEMFVGPTYSICEYIVNSEGVFVEKEPTTTTSSSEDAVSSLSSTRGMSPCTVTIDVVKEDSLFVAKEMLPEKSLFQKTVAAFLDQVSFYKSSNKALNEFLAFLDVNSRRRNDFLFGEDGKLKITRLKSFRSLTGDRSRDEEINTFLSFPAVQAFIDFFDASDQAEKDFDEIRRNLLREVGHFLHRQRQPCNRVLVLNMAHPSLRGSQPDSQVQEAHFYRAIAGLTGLERDERFKTACLHKDHFASVKTLLVRDATVFRQGSEYILLHPSEQYQIDLIYSAAPSTGREHSRKECLRKAIYAQLHTAKKEGYKDLVLSEFGCNEKNDPAVVAKLYSEILKSWEFRYAFKRIRFAISNSVNFSVFKEEFPSLSMSFLGEPSYRSAFTRSIPRDHRSTSSSISGSADTTMSALSSTREFESDELHQQKERGNTSMARSRSTEFFKSTQTGVANRESLLTPEYH